MIENTPLVQSEGFIIEECSVKTKVSESIQIHTHQFHDGGEGICTSELCGEVNSNIIFREVHIIGKIDMGRAREKRDRDTQTVEVQEYLSG